ncbi:MAG: thiopeptide-type bacteriocin biosynthesis protein [Bacteroidales bacterium]|nr:thiopeptide-type bacteriocin biosynthesis protein [Bacteroidales bacterium]
MNTIQRTFIPGTQWIYLKIYTGITSSDSIITTELFSIVSQLEKENTIRKWFFIRYSDPNHHIRVRFLVKDPEGVGRILHLFSTQFEELIKTKVVWKIQVDTYQRELERYGNHLIEYAESFFHIDSMATQRIIRKILTKKNEDYRWMIALKMMDVFLSQFKFNLQIKHKLLDSLSKSFKSEFGFTEHNSKIFNYKFRDSKKTIESVLNNTLEDPFLDELVAIVDQYSNATHQVVLKLHAAMQQSSGNKHVYDLVFSYLHMMLNRLFITENRKCELIIYDYMRRYYSSEIAKIKYQSITQ